MKKLNLIASLSSTLVLLLFLIVSGKNSMVNAANPGEVIINEIVYNPSSDVDGDEFLELYNTTASPINLEGWCFSRGITLCFSPGTIIDANSYAVISPGTTRTLSTYGVSTIGTYTGKLDNGGERLTLIDETAQVIADFTYDDIAPWPTTPDGTGPSLELKNPSSDYTQAGSWAASVGAPTPEQANSVYGIVLPTMTNLTKPTGVTSSSTPTVTVQAQDADSVNLIYKVMFGTEQTLTMNDDGNNGDAAAGDDIYSAVLPAQSAGQLVRYRIESENGDGSAHMPGNDDTINYYGYAVQDAGFATQLPVLQWFIDEDDLDDMVTNHSFTDQDFDCVIAYGDTVIDNAKVHIKGGVNRNFDKKSFAIDLPKGHKLLIGSDMTEAVDEFHLNSDYIDPSGTIVATNWQIAKDLGLPTRQTFKVRLQGNASFYGVYTFLEEDDKAWRERTGYEQMSYHGTDSPKTNIVADPAAELQQWRDALTVPRSETRREYALDNSNVPSMVNYMAFMTLIRNCEWHNGKNMIKVHDVQDTNRWEVLPYDIDCSIRGTRSMNTFDVAPAEYSILDRFQFDALYEEKDLRQVYYRRLRTMADKYLVNDQYINIIQDLYDRMQPDIELDSQKWHIPGASAERLEEIKAAYKTLKEDILVRYRYNNVVPAPQSDSAVVNIESISANNSDPNEDYVVLKNNTSSAIDISGWHIPELDFIVPEGAGIAPGQSAYIPRHDATFKVAGAGRYVLGQLNQDIPILGTITLYRTDNTASDTKSVT